jgi:hypothetical protein
MACTFALRRRGSLRAVFGYTRQALCSSGTQRKRLENVEIERKIVFRPNFGTYNRSPPAEPDGCRAAKVPVLGTNATQLESTMTVMTVEQKNNKQQRTCA